MFSHFKDKKYAISFFNGVSDAGMGRDYQHLTWQELKDLFSHFERSRSKDVGMFIPAILKPEDQWVRGTSNLITGKEKTFRNQNNFSHLSMAVLDLDEPKSLEQAMAKFSGFSYIVHSTFSYSEETPYKYRMILPLSEPIAVGGWEEFYLNLMRGIDGDYSCRNVSRGYNLPTLNLAAGVKPVFKVNEGDFLSLDPVMKMSKSISDEKSDVALSKVKTRSSERRVSNKIHPSGVAITPSYSGEDLSYEMFEKRHSQKIRFHFNGGKGNRHDFAIDVINSEMGIFKERTRFDLLIQFIFKATLEHSTQPLSTGNTAEELPEMIESGMSFMLSPDKLSSPEFIKRVNDEIKKGVSVSLDAEKNGEWLFPVATYEKRVLGNSLKSFEGRYRSLLIKFESELQEMVRGSSGDVNRGKMHLFNDVVLVPVLSREIKGNSRFSPQSMGKFLLKVMMKNGVGKDSVVEYGKMVERLSKHIASKVPNLKEDVVKRDMNMAVVVSHVLDGVGKKDALRYRAGYASGENSPNPS